MNEKMDRQIIDFMNEVGWYISMEYDQAYSDEFCRETTLNSLYEFIGSYYMGGNNVPDTAGIIIDTMKILAQHKKTKN